MSIIVAAVCMARLNLALLQAAIIRRGCQASIVNTRPSCRHRLAGSLVVTGTVKLCTPVSSGPLGYFPDSKRSPTPPVRMYSFL